MATMSSARTRGLWLLIQLLDATTGSQEKVFSRQKHTLQKGFCPKSKTFGPFQRQAKVLLQCKPVFLPGRPRVTAWSWVLRKIQRWATQVPLQEMHAARRPGVWLTDSLHQAAPSGASGHVPLGLAPGQWLSKAVVPWPGHFCSIQGPSNGQPVPQSTPWAGRDL